MKILVIGDPVESLNPRLDASLYWARHLFEKSHSVFWAEPTDLSWLQHELFVYASAWEQAGSRKELPKFKKSSKQKVSGFDWVLIRKEPPVEETYIQMALMLQNLSGPRFFNQPELLLRFHEKNLPLMLCGKGILEKEDVMPSCLSSKSEDWSQFVKENPASHYIVKPWSGHGGRGVQRYTKEELLSFLNRAELSPQSILQAYNPAVETKGDRRVIILRGEIIGNFVRLPKEGSYLANLIHGATTQKMDSSTKEKSIARRVADWSREVGLDFIGIDLIAERLTEINITCPTGILIEEDLTGQSLWPFFESYFEGRAS